jgi:hypothetical protein
MESDKIKIKENSWIAKLAARKLHTNNMAIVIGKTIHLHNATRRDLLQNEKWLKHEMCHIRQFQQHGFVSFIAKYLWQSVKKGYHNNNFEVAAREAEKL